MKNPDEYSIEKFLIEELQRGNIHAYERLFHKYYSILLSYTRQFMQELEAEEIVQEIMIWIWEKRESIQIDTSLRQYLIRMAHNKMINSFRRNQIKIRIETLFYEQFYSKEEFYPNIQLNELSDKITEAIQQLPDTYRQTFIMHRMENKTHKEIATELNVSVQTVNYHIGQAVKQLRIALKDFLIFLPVAWFLAQRH